jgi:hypothetical protein
MSKASRFAATIAAAAMTGQVCGASIALVGGCNTQAGASASAVDKITPHDCAGKNNCKGQGGCDSGDHGCSGKNSCKGKGGCEVK